MLLRVCTHRLSSALPVQQYPVPSTPGGHAAAVIIVFLVASRPLSRAPPLTWRNLDGPGPAKPALRPNKPLFSLLTASGEAGDASDAAREPVESWGASRNGRLAQRPARGLTDLALTPPQTTKHSVRGADRESDRPQRKHFVEVFISPRYFGCYAL